MRELEVGLKELINKAVRSYQGEYYYFDEKGIYQKVEDKEALKILKNVFLREDGSTYYLIYNAIYKVENANIFRSAISKLQVGQTFEDFKVIYGKTEIRRKEKPKGLDRFILKIDSPVFVRLPENSKSNVFDYIHVDVFVVSEWRSDIYEYIKKNQKDIKERVLKSLEKNKKFKKYAVPMNFLRLANATYSRRRNLIRFVFELKRLKHDHV